MRMQVTQQSLTGSRPQGLGTLILSPPSSPDGDFVAEGSHIQTMELQVWVQIPALPLASCVTLGKLLDVSVVNFLRYKIGTVTAHSLAGSWRGLQEIVHIHTGLW